MLLEFILQVALFAFYRPKLFDPDHSILYNNFLRKFIALCFSMLL